MTTAEDPVMLTIIMGQIPSSFLPSSPWQTPGLAFGGHQCSAAAAVGALQEMSRLSLPHCSAIPLHSRFPKPGKPLKKKGFRGKRRIPNLSMGFAVTSATCRAPTMGTGGSREAAAAGEPRFAGLKRRARGHIVFEKSGSLCVQFTGKFGKFSALVLCVISFLFGSCASYLEILLWPPFWIIIFCFFPTVHYQLLCLHCITTTTTVTWRNSSGPEALRKWRLSQLNF